MNNRIFYILLFSLVIFVGSVKAQQADSLLDGEQIWQQANASYVDKDYGAAIEQYNTILDQGVSSAELLYNLGNAYYKRGELAKSILYYNKALKLAPTDADIIYNLKVAEEQTRDHIEEVPEFVLSSLHRRMYSNMTSNQWTIFSLVMLVVVGVCVLLFFLSSYTPLRKASFFGMLLFAVIFAISTSYAVSQRNVMLDDSMAIVMVKSITVKSSPDSSATDLFILNEGTKVSLNKSMGEWIEITIADGKQGWINRSTVELI